MGKMNWKNSEKIGWPLLNSIVIISTKQYNSTLSQFSTNNCIYLFICVSFYIISQIMYSEPVIITK